MLLKTGLLILSLAGAIACGTTDSGESVQAIPGKIAFSAKDDGGTFQIFTMNADASDIRQLADDEFFSVDPSLSPDGGQIVFIPNRDYLDADTLRSKFVYTLSKKEFQYLF